MNKIANYLWEAAGNSKHEVSRDNPFKKIGFDGESPRLGWVKPPSWEAIERALKRCLAFIGNKDEFIFVGMGGSINGIKALFPFNKKANIHYLDSLDPQALGEILATMKHLESVMVIPISKSGTTKETHLLAATLRKLFTQHAKKHFLWLVDKNSWGRLDSLGWKGFRRLSIQVDDGIDIGGRFTSPHTLVFLLPLLLMMERNFSKVRKCYMEYLSLRERIVAVSLHDALQYKNKKQAYFSVPVPVRIVESFRTWVTQLFQESLGSKIKDFSVKTLVGKKRGNYPFFCSVSFDARIKDPIVDMMATMHYLQNFIAFFASSRGLNFVNQPSVEKYKQQMKKLSSKDIKRIPSVDIGQLIAEVKRKKKSHHKFIEVILYFHGSEAIRHAIRGRLRAAFPQCPVFIFSGSDWNHHSYQAAFLDRDTLFILLTRNDYTLFQSRYNVKCIKENIQVLRIIAYATYMTIRSKALLLALAV